MNRFVLALVAALAAAAAFGLAADAATEHPWERTVPKGSTMAYPAAGTLTSPRVIVRARPGATAPAIAALRRFRPDFVPQIVLAVGSTRTAKGALWYRVSVPGRPNGRTGWIPATAADLTPARVHIVIRRDARRIEVWREGSRVLTAKIAVGAPGMETPLGRFYVTARWVPADSFLGVFALETSAYSRLSEWPGGGVIGIHGTSLPQLLGQAVSHGCVRVSNGTAVRLRGLVPLGTPIWILA